MLDFIKLLFDTSDFPARWQCGNWTSAHGWTHIVADLAIAAAYCAIPVVLTVFLRRRRDAPYPPLFLLFSAFILFCGVTHFAEATIFWNPWYRFSGLLKVCTALVSWVTVLMLLRVVPEALKLPGLAVVNAELMRSNHELDQFAYVASHDLREPLRGVDNLSKWICEDLDDNQLPGTTRRHLQQLRQQVGRMEGILDDLREYSRVGRTTSDPEQVDCGELARNLARLCHDSNRIHVRVDAEMPTFKAARVPLETCLRNLVSNAVKHHHRADGHVRISARSVGDFVEFAVSDDGPGISPEYHERIFEMFQRLHPRADDESDGSGMGLAIVKKIVENHGGEITVESSEGNGATFRLRWPHHGSAAMAARN